MSDPRALRNGRLTREYNEIMRINGSVIGVEPIGSAPYDKYKITFNVRTIISPAPTYRRSTVCMLNVPPGYPEDQPVITANDTPYPWHINWYKDGRWCHGHWSVEESLVNFVIRCARTLQFDPVLANTGSKANYDAETFWLQNVNNPRVIPCDRTSLPTLGGSSKKIEILGRSEPQRSPTGRKITINSRND